VVRLLALLVAIAAVALGLPGVAPATVLVTPEGSGIDGALQRCADRNPLAGVPIVTIDTTYVGLADRDGYAWPGTYVVSLSTAADCATLLHELGHEFDYHVLTDYDRVFVMRTLGLHGDWRQPVNSPHEQFAELYMMAATHRTWQTENIAIGYGLADSMARNDRGKFAVLRSWLVNYDRFIRDQTGRPVGFKPRR